MFEKMSRSLKYDSMFFVHKHIYTMDTSPDHITPCLHMHVEGNYNKSKAIGSICIGNMVYMGVV